MEDFHDAHGILSFADQEREFSRALRKEALAGEARGEARGVDKSRLESITNVMEGLKYTAQQAMDLLKIPENEQPKYLAKL